MIKNAIFNGSLSFKLIEKKHKPAANKKLSAKLVRGRCIKLENGEYMVSFDSKSVKDYIPSNYNNPTINLPFTEESYELKGVVSVFAREKIDGRWVRYIRNENQCKFFPGSKESLVPFRPGWDITGYIVKKDNKILVQFNDCVPPEGYIVRENEEEV